MIFKYAPSLLKLTSISNLWFISKILQHMILHKLELSHLISIFTRCLLLSCFKKSSIPGLILSVAISSLTSFTLIKVTLWHSIMNYWHIRVNPREISSSRYRGKLSTMWIDFKFIIPWMRFLIRGRSWEVSMESPSRHSCWDINAFIS